MPPPIHITDPGDPRLADYADLKDAALRDAEFRGVRGRFIAESELVVRALIASGFPVASVLIESGREVKLADALARLDPSVPVFIADRRVLEGITGFAFHRGVLACGVRPPPVDWRTVASRARVLVIAEGISNADNMGAIFRNTACIVGEGAAVLLAPGCCDPLYRKSMRVSIGHALRVPFARVEPWPDALVALYDLGFVTIALSPSPEAIPIREWSAAGCWGLPAFLIGAEGPGLRAASLNAARVRVRIPMAPGADSLNVATALAVALSWMPGLV